MVGVIADLEEAGLLRQFKEAVVDLKQEDIVLLRFLRARNHDLNKAEEMIRYAMQWRQEIGIDNYMKWEFPEYYQTEMAYKFFGKCRENPNLWVFVGKWNGKTLVDNGEGENLLLWALAMIEQGMRVVHDTKKQGNVIIDLQGLTYSQATHIGSLKLFYQGCQKIEQCYPEIIKSVTIINAPWVFTLGFNFIKGIITRKTMEKIKIIGCNKNEWMAELQRKLPNSSIVPELAPRDENGN
ncbi:SEC14-like protein 4 [Orchesella cincta]|uniref:SEC14-like protein 4 n=1 Tax=Orchesella cincta TaxID=48709 RepID=A0A1D2MCK1_ORCCI|nr:SEC14-like protein 4 [Orchesella cincta]